MVKINWKKVGQVLGIVGIVGGAAGLGAQAIAQFKPETVDIPAAHRLEMTRIAEEAIKKASEKS